MGIALSDANSKSLKWLEMTRHENVLFLFLLNVTPAATLKTLLQHCVMEEITMDFATALRNETAWTLTENGAIAKSTTGDACLDLFSSIGALRNADDNLLFTLFEEAYAQDRTLATKILFYARDIREGTGEREIFRKLIRYLADKHPESIRKNIRLIGEYGRFDDLYSFIGTTLEEDMWVVMRSQFAADVINMNNNKPCSLLAKWIKTPDASSKKTRELGIMTALKFGYSVYDFKRILRKLRRYLDVTEVKMSANRWSEIDYSAVPSRAMRNYSKAFYKHDTERFSEFGIRAANGEVSINSSTLYPYDLVEKYLGERWHSYNLHYLLGEDPIVEAQWKQLPNYIEPGTNAIVIADTSGSMIGRPINSAVGLAIYFAERNVGAYHDLFMSFSNESTIHKLRGNTLAQKLRSIDMSDWGGSTNLEAAFNNVLRIAVENHIPTNEMVKSIIVISDMEINRCTNNSWTFYDYMSAKYASYGYEIPNVVFWNVDSRHDIFHADSNRKGVQLFSGQSTTTFKQLIESVGLTPRDAMLKTINSERYSQIIVE